MMELTPVPSLPCEVQAAAWGSGLVMDVSLMEAVGQTP